MVDLLSLWLPILLSAVLVFVASSVLHMALPIHKGDYGQLPGEDEVLAAMRERGVQPGQYMFPHASSMKDLASPEMVAKFERGPVGTTVVIPSGPPTMGKNLVQWFVFSVVVSIFVAYIAGLGLSRGTEYMMVFRMTGAIAFLGYAFSHAVDSIWKGLSWGVTVKFMFDGLVYSLVTAGTFAWLWPTVQ
jgi:hypothetical protein